MSYLSHSLGRRKKEPQTRNKQDLSLINEKIHVKKKYKQLSPRITYVFINSVVHRDRIKLEVALNPANVDL